MRSQARGNRTRARILNMIQLRESAERAPAPTIREIAKVTHLSVATVHRHIEVMTAMGVLEHTPGLARTIRIRHNA